MSRYSDGTNRAFEGEVTLAPWTQYPGAGYPQHGGFFWR